MKRLIIVGGAGRMGQALGEGLSRHDDFEVVVMVDVHEPRELFGASYATSLPPDNEVRADVVIDFSSPQSVVVSAAWCATHHVGLVVGTTGLSDEQRKSVDDASHATGVLVAANFAIGAVLADRFAAMAAPFFDRVEIIELHHDKKVDAPSGTSLTSARIIGAARKNAGLKALKDPTIRETVEGARGADAADGVKVHSVRLPGLVAHQEILFGGPGEGLTIRHDSFDRQSFVQGVALAVRFVDATPKLTVGIDALLGD